MTRTEYVAAGKKTDEQLALLSFVETAALERMVVERNAAGTAELAAKEKASADLATKAKEHQDALAAIQQQHADAMAAKAAEMAATQAQIAEAQKLIDAAGGTTAVRKMRLQKEAERQAAAIAQAAAAKTAAEAELAKLG